MWWVAVCGAAVLPHGAYQNTGAGGPCHLAAARIGAAFSLVGPALMVTGYQVVFPRAVRIPSWVHSLPGVLSVVVLGSVLCGHIDGGGQAVAVRVARSARDRRAGRVASC